MSTGLNQALNSSGMNLLKIPTKSQNVSNLFNQSVQQAQPGISNSINQWSRLAGGGDQDLWDQLEAPALRQHGALQGSLASRFSGGFGQGGSGARHSSGFRNTMSEANTDLAERLQGQRLGLQQGAQDRLMQLYNSIMGTNEFENVLAPKQMSFLKQLLLSGAGGVGNLASGAGNLGIAKWMGLFK